MKIRALIFLIVGGASVAAAEIPEPPMPRSPIADFREWLKKSPGERQVALAKRSEASRNVLAQKLRDYSAMPAEERERRLDATELRWYLRQMLKVPKAQRDLAMASVPVPWQPMVMQGLTHWDQMSPELQKAV